MSSIADAFSRNRTGRPENAVRQRLRLVNGKPLTHRGQLVRRSPRQLWRHPLKVGLASEAALHKYVGGSGRTTTISSAPLIPQAMGDLLVEVSFDLFVGEAIDDFI